MIKPHFLWCITGASHMLGECLQEFSNPDIRVDVAESAAAEEILRFFGLSNKIKEVAQKLYLETAVGTQPMLITKPGYYEKIFIAPATANTVAKIGLGIADTLITNIAAQAVKKQHKPIIFPTDNQKNILSTWGKGETRITARPVDLKNVSKLKGGGEYEVIDSPKKIRHHLGLV